MGRSNMEMVETEENMSASMETQGAEVVTSQDKDNKKLLSICETKDNIPETKMAPTELSNVPQIVCEDKHIAILKSSGSSATEKKEVDKVEVKECTENVVQSSEEPNPEKKDSESTTLEMEPKVSKNETINDTPTKTGISNRRKRKSITAQESDSTLEEGSFKNKRRKSKCTTDKFCWRCHKEYVDAYCTACPRSWHRKCIGGMQPTTAVQNWICGECATILRAENAETRSTSMAQLSVDQLCLLLRYVVDRMREYPGSEPFWKPVEDSDAPNYQDYVVKPMDLSLLESNVRAKLYGSTDAFIADAKWIQHNCIVFNTCGGVYADTSKLTNAAKQMIKLARQEVSEIEACPDCFAHGRNIPRPQPSWFIEPCRRPHPLVWAKLKGFPFWPAKAMPRVNTQGFVDVRFFGQHDRAWVSPRDMFLYSEDPPVPQPRKRKVDMEECVREITRHCRKLELVFGQFKFAPPKVPYNPSDPLQIKLMLPNYDPLQPNDAVSPLSTPKRKVAVRKRVSLTKAKSQAVSDITDLNTSTTPNSNMIASTENVDESIKIEKKVETSLSFTTKPNEQSADTAVLKSNNKIVKSERVNSESDIEEIIVEGNGKGGVINAESAEEKCKVHDSDSKSNKPEAAKVDKTEAQQTLDSHKDNIISSTQRRPTKRSSNISERSPPKAQKLEKDAGVLISKRLAQSENSPGNQAPPAFKILKPITKVYKPKTRMVDKVNAEKALKSVPIKEGQKSNSADVAVTLTSPVRNGPELMDAMDISSNQALPATPVPLNKSQAQSGTASPAAPAVTVTSKSGTDQSVALLLVVNSGVPEPLKQSVSDKDVTGVAQLSKDPTHVAPLQKKESKAKKSFPNKPRTYVQIAARPSPNAASNSNDSIPVLFIPSHQDNDTTYQLVPPEAGPLSARMYHGAQDLTRKMAQLMEEAYKEAAQELQYSESGSPENRQASVHFLKLQIERMRWQHQQQLAELKHNTDRILREMRTSLEAERLRAIEETRREAEQEKTRCIEEIKRKQWCAMCGHEAVFYCCWNTAYCDYPCQQLHWPTHVRTCAQQPSHTTIVTSSAANTSQTQSMPRLVTPSVWRA